MKRSIDIPAILVRPISSVILVFSISACEVEAEDGPNAVGEFVQPVGFEDEGQVVAGDRDGDGFPDITEQQEGTDISDPSSNPYANYIARDDSEQAGFPAATCRPGFIPAGPRLCITQLEQSTTQYRYAVSNCRNMRSDVCSIEDFDYLFYNSNLDASYNTWGHWIGNTVADDQVLCGNESITYDNHPYIFNFEGTCNVQDVRAYWCCHDAQE